VQVKSERHAWELAKDADFELVVVNPGLFIGPPATSRAAGESLDLMKKIFEGTFPAVYDDSRQPCTLNTQSDAKGQ
jgi:hypothetical protein